MSRASGSIHSMRNRSIPSWSTRRQMAAVADDLSWSLRSGQRTSGALTKNSSAKILGAAIDHGGNPIARWMIQRTARAYFDEHMNFAAPQRNDPSNRSTRHLSPP